MKKRTIGCVFFLGMVGINKKMLKGGRTVLTPSGMSMKKLCVFKCVLETKATCSFEQLNTVYRLIVTKVWTYHVKIINFLKKILLPSCVPEIKGIDRKEKGK